MHRPRRSSKSSDKARAKYGEIVPRCSEVFLVESLLGGNCFLNFDLIIGGSYLPFMVHEHLESNQQRNHYAKLGEQPVLGEPDTYRIKK